MRLHQQSEHPGAALQPDLILLDLNLPVIHGAKILDVIRTTAEWQHLPVMVLSSSTLKKDQEQAARHGIEAYLDIAHLTPPEASEVVLPPPFGLCASRPSTGSL